MPNRPHNTASHQNDSADYKKRKRLFDSLLTIYGRKPVLEALQAKNITLYRLHLADTNKLAGTLCEIILLAEKQAVEIVYHNRKELSRISKNGKQDQGVAADLQCQNYRHLDDFIAHPPSKNVHLIALDGVTNPQNLGMIIRSVCASKCDGLILPQKGSAEISALVIKASAGTLFQCPILRCDDLASALQALQKINTKVCTLSSHSEQTLSEFQPNSSVVYVLGNETDGVSNNVMNLSDVHVKIPMNNGVESLNVAITAALVAFKNYY
jgi:23S rRNA (guanosine2251-2'-O)-methyltransferase